jgi:hypothetical protein
MKRAQLEILVLLGVTISPAPTRLAAQANGQFVGSVSDASGAVIPNATLRAVEERTQFTRSTVTTSAGTYTLAAMPVGSYKLTVTASSFKTATAQVSLDVNQQREVNFTLTVAQVATEVQVSAAPPLLTTATATLGQVVTGPQVVSLPLNGRDLTNLILLQPGTVADNGDTAAHHALFPGYTSVSNGGSRPSYVSSYVDGVDATDNVFGGPQLTNFNLDAIAEFGVLQNDFSAKYGRGAGMVVNMVSKSGTNKFHGDVFEFLRNTRIDARNFFSAGPSPLQRNEFGGVFGGPIKKDRTFFFFDYAGLRQLSGPPTFLAVPTNQERQGIVNATINGQAQQLMVPMTSSAQTVLNKYPMPNDPTGPYGACTYLVDLKIPISENQYSFRLDQRFSEKDSIFGRFTYSNNGLPIVSASMAAIDPTWSPQRIWNVRNFGITETHLFSPTTMNSLTLSWVRTIEGNFQSTVSDLTSSSFSDGQLAAWGPFRGGFTIRADGGVLNDSVTMQKGRHALEMGIEYRPTSDSETGVSLSKSNGVYTFRPGTPTPLAIPIVGGGMLPAGSPSPNSEISLMLGIPDNVVRTEPFPGFGAPDGSTSPYTLKDWHINGWVQDDIKATPRLTLNLGLRYEYNSVPRETSGRITAIDDVPQWQGGNLYLRMLLNPQPVWFPDHKGFGPRFGLAYRIKNSTVLRGGFGIFTTGARLGIVDQSPANFPLGAFATIQRPSFSLTPPLVFNSTAVLRDLQGNPLPPNGNTKLVPPNTPISFPSAVAAIGGNGVIETNITSMSLRNGYIESGNLTLEHEFGDFLGRVSYVVTNAVGLYGDEWPNAYNGALPQFSPYSNANPGLGEFTLLSNFAHSTYNALQITVRKTSLRHGLQFQASYTFSKEIDNASGDVNGSAAGSDLVQNNPTCWRCEKALGNASIPNRFVANFLYSLPLGKWNALPNRVAHGWQIGGILTAQSGVPFTVTSPYGTTIYGLNTFYGIATRPFFVQNPSKYNGTAAQYFSAAVLANQQQYFATPTVGGLQTAPGNLGRNTFRAPAWWNFDFVTQKDTKINEQLTLQFRGDFFNLFNLHDFGTPGALLGSANFGKFTGTVFNERLIQFALKLIF